MTASLQRPRAGVSVALATYNGREHLAEQLESLAEQSHRPDELVVYDDASSDGTPEFVERFAARAPFEVRLLRGQANLGVNAAFAAAVSQAREEIVFLCDQDDRWHPDKVRVMSAALREDEDRGYVFCDAHQMTAKGDLLPASLWEQVRFTRRRQEQFARNPMQALLRGPNFVYGMAAAFRTEALRRVLPITASAAAMTHDTWFALHLSGTGLRGTALPDKLTFYRRHEGQTTAGTAGKDGLDAEAKARRERLRLVELCRALEDVARNIQASPQASPHCREAALREIRGRIEHLRARIDLRDSMSPLSGLRSLLGVGYWRYASGPLSVVRDMKGW